MNDLVARVAAKHVRAEGLFAEGDAVRFGKYKNKRGKIIRFFEDERGVPSVEIEPVPKGRKQNVEMGLYKIWKADMRKEACIVFSKKCDGDVVLGKVRDRMYDPEICIYHMEVDGTEMCVMFDRITGFCEGVNEHGIGIVNSTLMVLQDEREGVADGDNEPERSPDGVKIIKALTYGKIGDVLQSLILHKPKRFKRGLKGHTLVSDGNKVYALENTRIHAPKSMKLDADRVHTRTNHGIYYPGAGYTKGPDYISSIVRRWEAQKQLEKAQHAEDLMPALTQAIEKVPSAFNPTRFTDKMRTTSQFVVDPKNRRVHLYLVPEHSDFKGVRNLLPGGREPKIKTKIYKYPGKDKLQDSTITVPEEMSIDSAKRERADAVTEPERVAARVVARYKSKKKVKTQDGEDMTVYEYSDRQVANRNRGKAERIEKLRTSMKKLQAKVRKDVKSKDEKTRDLAVAVGLMDETFERVGNPQSAKEGHFGVTTWRVKHVKFGKGGATITYVGKSGVDQKKKITTATIVGALKKICKDKKPDDCILSVSASEVNNYLKELGITAKDIRGFHANTMMKEELRKVRKGNLPADPKEKAKKLKDEFKKALEATAERVGHEASTLKSQYLVPGVEDDYLRDGTVNESHTKKGSILRTAAEQGTPTERRILANAVNAPVLVARSRAWWLREAPNLYRIAREQERPRPEVEGLQFPPEMFSVLWHEDDDNNRLDEDGDGIPDGARFQYSQFPATLHDSILRLNDDGTSTEIMRGERGFPQDLVTEMVRSGEWDVGDAIMAAAQACERCLNALTFRYQRDDGYEFGSSRYWQAATRCKMCDHVDNAPEDMHRHATKSDAEVEEEKVQKMLRPEPKQKPPRYDLRDNRTLDEEDEEILGGGDGGDRDLSMKWNKVARRVAFQWIAVPRGVSGARVALWHVAEAGAAAPGGAAPGGAAPGGAAPGGGEKPSFDEWVKDQKWPSKAENAEPGDEVGFRTLETQDPAGAAKVREEYKRKFGVAGDDEGDKGEKKEDEPKERSQEEISKDLDEARDKEDALKGEAKELKKKIREHEKNIEQLKDSLGAEAPKPGEKREQLEARIDETKDKLKEDAARMEALGGEIDELGGKATALKKTLAEHQSNIDRLEAQAGQPRPEPGEKKEKIQKRLDEARTKISDGAAEAEGLNGELDELEDKLDDLDIARRETKKLVGDLLKGTRNMNPDNPDVQAAREDMREGRREFRRLEAQIKEQKGEIASRKKRIDEIKQQEKAASDLIGKLETALEEPEEAQASPDELKAQIQEERKAQREAEQQAEDLNDEIKGKKAEHKQLRQQAKSGDALVEKMEGALGEIEDETPASPDEVKQKVKEETAKLRDAEDAFEEKVGDLKAQKKVVDDLKDERTDPSGAKRKKKEDAERKKKERVEKAVKKTEETLQATLGKSSDLPKDLKGQVEAMLDGLSDDQVEAFATGFADRLGKHTELDPTGPEAVGLANEAAAFGDIAGLDDPVEIANRLADLAYGRNVVANPLITGGKPVGQTVMDDAAYGERALDGFRQFQNLHPALRRRAVETIQQHLRGLDEDTHRAQELNAILTGMDVAQIADTGEALPGRPQPSKGNAALFRKMVQNGDAERLFIPAEDFFAEQGRVALADAMREMTPQEVASLATSGSKSHPYSDLHDLIHNDQTPDAMKAMMQSFLAQDILNDAWGDRAIRDTMEAAGAPDADDPEVRDAVSQEAKKREAPNREKAMEARERVEQARVNGEEPAPEDVTAMEVYFDKEQGPGLMGNMRSLMTVLKDKFKQHVVSPATAVLNHVLNTGDTSALSQETLPHPDEGAAEPRSREERETARAEAETPGTRQKDEKDMARHLPVSPEAKREKEERDKARSTRGEPLTEMASRVQMRAEKMKLESQREKVTGEARDKLDARIKEITDQLGRGAPGGSAQPPGTRKERESENTERPIKKLEKKHEKVRDLTDDELDNEAGEYFENDFTQAALPGAFKDAEDLKRRVKEAEVTHLDAEQLADIANSDVGDILRAEDPAARARELAKEYGRDIGQVERGISEGADMPPVILLKDKNGKLVLMGGNTRLMGGAAAGTSMPVKIVEVDSEYDEEAGAAAGGAPEGDEKKERKSGDVWQTEGGRWGAKNKAGNTDTFDSREKAEVYAKGEQGEAEKPEAEKPEAKSENPKRQRRAVKDEYFDRTQDAVDAVGEPIQSSMMKLADDPEFLKMSSQERYARLGETLKAAIPGARAVQVPGSGSNASINITVPEEHRAPGVTARQKIRLQPDSAGGEASGKGGHLGLGVRDLLEAKTPEEIKAASARIMGTMVHEMTHIYGHQGTNPDEFDDEDKKVRHIRYITDPGEQRAHAKEFAWRYAQDYPEEGDVDFDKLEEAHKGVGKDWKIRQYFQQLGDEKVQAKYDPEIQELMREASEGMGDLVQHYVDEYRRRGSKKGKLARHVAAQWLATHRSEHLAASWLAHVRSIHPDDPNRPIVVVRAA